MSVCVVAKYPWRAAQPYAAGEPAGAILCSDTRVTKGERVLNFICPKQLKLGRNIVGCFTSSNLYATSRAFAQSINSGNLRKVERALRETHKSIGGATELLAVVSKRGRDLKVLELMSPVYKPEPRAGIVGIGDPATLDRFAADFDPICGPPPTPTLSPAAIESLRRAVGRTVKFPPRRFTINDAELQIAAALAACRT